jgi:hypothetical protein
MCIAPEHAVKQLIKGFKRPEKKKRRGKKKTEKDIKKLLIQDDFLISEVAALVGKNPRTVQIWIKDEKLYQEYPFAKIKRAALLEWANRNNKLLAWDLKDAAKKKEREIAFQQFTQRKGK